jgi:hypothetical protein
MQKIGRITLGHDCKAAFSPLYTHDRACHLFTGRQAKLPLGSASSWKNKSHLRKTRLRNPALVAASLPTLRDEQPKNKVIMSEFLNLLYSAATLAIKLKEGIEKASHESHLV